MWFFVAIFFLAGVGLVSMGRKLERQARIAATWPVTTGKLERCEVIERPGIGAEDLSTWHLDLRYSYEVDGVRYESDRYAFGYGDPRDDGKHRQIAATLQAAPRLSVHYDPRRPSEAVISTASPGNIGTLGYGMLALAGISALIALGGH